MSWSFVEPLPIRQHVKETLDALALGRRPSEVEARAVDCKEEPGRRGRQGEVLPGQQENEEAARYLAGELACMANTPGGGAIILGIANDGRRIGTELDPEWLRQRVYAHTQKRLTPHASEVHFDGVRLIVLEVGEALEPIRVNGPLRWRVGDSCVEMDLASWTARREVRAHQAGYDWSALRSPHPAHEADAQALAVARAYLRDAASRGDRDAADLAAASDADLLRRLSVVTGDEHLTNAGALLFVGTPNDGLDYIRRSVPGGDRLHRELSRRPLLVQLDAVETAAHAANRLVATNRSSQSSSFAQAQVRAIPPRALREAIVNGVVHRDWAAAAPTTVEHLGDRLTVTSPGGFIGGIQPGNIITHPSSPRYRRLAHALSKLRLAEREGIGVDRMIGDMLALGHPTPDIAEGPGPSVRVTLVGGEPDAQVLAFLAAMTPADVATSLDTLLILTHLREHGWVDAMTIAPVLQRAEIEADASLRALAAASVHGASALVAVAGVPSAAPIAWRLPDATREPLTRMPFREPGTREVIIRRWFTHRGRISSTEAADLTGVTVQTAGSDLTSLEAAGALRPVRASKRGRDFHYLPV